MKNHCTINRKRFFEKTIFSIVLTWMLLGMHPASSDNATAPAAEGISHDLSFPAGEYNAAQTRSGSAGKTSQTMIIRYKSNNYYTIDTINYNETGRYKVSRIQTTYNADETLKSETTYSYKNNSNTVESKTTTDFNNDGTQTVKTYKTVNKALKLVSTETIVSQAQTQTSNIEKEMSEDGTSIVSVTYATDPRRSISGGTITEIKDEYGNVTGYKQELFTQTSFGGTIIYDADLYLTSYVKKSGQKVFFPENTVNYDVFTQIYSSAGVKSPYKSIGHPGWCSCSIGDVAISIYDHGDKVRGGAWIIHSDGHDSWQIRVPGYTDENGDLHIYEEIKTVDGSDFILKYNPVQSSNDTWERSNTNLKSGNDEIFSVTRSNGKTIARPIGGAIEVAEDGGIVTYELRNNGNTNTMTTYDASGRIAFVTEETYDDNILTKVVITDKMTNRVNQLVPDADETLVKNDDGSYSLNKNNAVEYIHYDCHGVMTSTALILTSSGRTLKINGEDVAITGNGTFAFSFENNNVMMKAASSNASSIVFDNTKDLNITVEKSDNFPDAIFDLKTGAGNDTIYISEKAKVKTLDTKAGNDTIINAGSVDSIQAGAGDDTVINYGTAMRIKADNGDDNIINKGTAQKIDAGADNDIVINNTNIIFEDKNKNFTLRYNEDAFINDAGELVVTSIFDDDMPRFRKIYSRDGDLLKIVNSDETILCEKTENCSITVDKDGTIKLIYRNNSYVIIDHENNFVKYVAYYYPTGKRIYCVNVNVNPSANDGTNISDFIPFNIQNVTSESCEINLNGNIIDIKNGYNAVIDIIGTSPDKLTITKEDGSFIEYSGQGTPIFNTITDFNILYYDDGRIASASAKFGNNTITVSREEALKIFNLTYMQNYTKVDINYLLLEDILITKYAVQKASFFEDENSDNYQNAYNSAIKSALIKTEDNMQNVAGEIVEIDNKLYANDGDSLIELNISAEKYLELFPPISRYQTSQGGTGDCAVVAAIVEGINNPKTFAKLLSIFSEDENNNLIVNLNGSFVTFENSELFVLDGLVNGETNPKYTMLTGCDGAKFIEQACVIAEFAKESRKTIGEIDIDEAANYISTHGSLQVYAMSLIFGCNTFERAQYSIKELNYDSSIFDNMSNEQIALYKEDTKNYIDAVMRYMDYVFGLQNIVREDLAHDVIVIDRSYTLESDESIWKSALKDDGNIDIDFLRQKEKEYLGYNKYTDLEFTRITQFINSNNYDNSSKLILEASKAKENLKNHIKENNDSEAIFNFADDIMKYSILQDDFIEMINRLDTVGFVETFTNMPNYIKENYYNYLDFLADKVAAGDILMGADIPLHARCVQSIDKENKIIKIMDPWDSYITGTFSYDEYFEKFDAIEIGYMDESLFNEHVLHMYAEFR